MTVDPVHLTQSLVRCRSVTPAEGGALVLLDEVLSEAGFACTRVDRGGVANLFARWGPSGHRRTLGFNGHTDVVPVDGQDWSSGSVHADRTRRQAYARGSCDMNGVYRLRSGSGAELRQGRSQAARAFRVFL